jgi:hypothetical protein
VREPVRRLLMIGLAAQATSATAATTGVYHPYLNEREREVEYGLIHRDLGGDRVVLHRASVGYAWSDRISTELYLLSDSPSSEGARARAYELEVKWQLTEQGEYSSDWGILFEAELGKDTDEHELAVGVLWEKELLHRWVAAANAMLEYEFGNAVDDEFETGFRAQLRYLHAPTLEPAVELYLDDEDYAIGPALLGAVRIGAGRQVRWELGVQFGIGHKTPDASLRTNIEIEF